jgi:hypothetical protein
MRTQTVPVAFYIRVLTNCPSINLHLKSQQEYWQFHLAARRGNSPLKSVHKYKRPLQCQACTYTFNTEVHCAQGVGVHLYHYTVSNLVIPQCWYNILATPGIYKILGQNSKFYTSLYSCHYHSGYVRSDVISCKAGRVRWWSSAPGSTSTVQTVSKTPHTYCVQLLLVLSALD